jgi:hypothetical protein
MTLPIECSGIDVSRREWIARQEQSAVIFDCKTVAENIGDDNMVNRKAIRPFGLAAFHITAK